MFNWLKSWWSFDAAAYQAPRDVPSPDEPRELVLYKYDSCPWCQRVMRVLGETGITLEFRDTRADPDNRQLLYDQTRRTQVPCMIVDGVPFFESSDISKWLRAYAVRGWPNRDKNQA